LSSGRKESKLRYPHIWNKLSIFKKIVVYRRKMIVTHIMHTTYRLNYIKNMRRVKARSMYNLTAR